MKLEIKRILKDEKLTQARLKDMRADEIIVANCAPDASAWKTAERIAYNVRKDHVRSDGMVYVIASSSADMSVMISLVSQ